MRVGISSVPPKRCLAEVRKEAEMLMHGAIDDLEKQRCHVKKIDLDRFDIDECYDSDLDERLDRRLTLNREEEETLP
ncbi:hypothetical protein E3N88_35955 [Mikania micrantha]|uniref:Uncharacterized protein n=1 Tax=Mikania micrantha TaxID=192012 RepID=A0A5N6M2E3_9ASTR|nr:hypothetical protein E3N88_35955 [Mikania micrantha]